MFTDEFLFAQALNIEEPMYIKNRVFKRSWRITYLY
ncbi:hypothetical protein HVS_01970 [Acetivibrio saccincola]|jgi:hypothetical protein|uniref:Uncharacterized protein n=1 Tax=Acetivibrio saccincola TaxID=1677857 RepID=A0A2K9EAY8_9FIRM|nr:hypothetical protein HVS_01970 [Acetivibrio saccincola]